VWIVLAVAWLASAGEFTDRQTTVVPMAAAKPVVIEITVGNVRIEGWDRPDAEITVERHAPTASSLARLPASIEEVPPGIVVRALQTGNSTDHDYRADVTVRLPRQATIERVQVLEGRITIEQFSGAITGVIQRGPIDGKDVAGAIRLETNIGDITLSNTRLSPNGVLRLRTFNGDVKLSLAERPANARIMALAVNGHIKSEIPLQTRHTWGPRWGEATLGKGQPVISLDVITGAIEIKSP
jgi:hypothetical protein